ncbi:hypothetical protein PVN32_28005, partial [Bacillus paralicheniformis]
GEKSYMKKPYTFTLKQTRRASSLEEEENKMKKVLLTAVVLGAVISFSFVNHAPEAASQGDQVLLASRGSGA